MALEGSVSHFRSNAGITKGEVLNYLDYIIYHMPFPKMAHKAHRHLVEIEYEKTSSEEKENIFKQSVAKMVYSAMGAVVEQNFYSVKLIRI